MNSTDMTSTRPTARRTRRLGIAAATMAMGAAATLMAAPSASAVGSSACNAGGAIGNWKTIKSNVNLRNGPGTGYYSKGQLAKGTVINMKCTWLSKDGKKYWYYGKVRTGYHKGAWGWISWKYAAIA
ncbi:SH3 domain-containing protein [Streptomyces sp. NBC_01304]|uniref:SH3 domain-containing protein n=1 Tax=Streptomyces sp. NBC_01304 TaxID=2903818 RepID=UPI002E154A5D|nr:SH3 domain-containing protein [Streptomyces sp. NBC_01304]